MMDRIEDETIRYLFFLQRAERAPAEEAWSEDLGGNGDGVGEPAAVGVGAEQRQAAQSSVLDLTRNIQRKKQKELDQLQFVGGATTTAKQPVLSQKKAGRNDPCPCGSGKKYKKCCGA
jgi:preprotein translocase subunit SecA